MTNKILKEILSLKTNLSDLIVGRWDTGQSKWKDEGNGSDCYLVYC